MQKGMWRKLWNHVESLMRAVEDKLAMALISTQEAARLAPDRSDSLLENYHKVKRDALARVRAARSKMSSTTPPSNTSSTNSVPSNRSLYRGDANAVRIYFQKQPFPRFSGESLDYLSFCKEWRETIAPSHEEFFQLWEIPRAVPAKIQPDLKNLRMMQEVWATLDEEFGQMMENVSGLVRRLLAFKYSNEAKGETSKFMELWRMWNEVCSDLHELSNIVVLNQEPTIVAVGNMQPSYSSKD